MDAGLVGIVRGLDKRSPGWRRGSQLFGISGGCEVSYWPPRFRKLFSDSRHNNSVKRDTLLDFFGDFADLPDPFLVYDDGFRVEQRTYRHTAQAARGLA